MPRPRTPRVPRHARWIAGGALVALLVAEAAWTQTESPSSTQAQQRPSLADFAGKWVRADGERDDAARHAEIERVTASMSFVMRGFARSVMRQRMQPDAELTLTLGSKALGVHGGREKRPAIQPDGVRRTTAESGEVMDRLLPDGRIGRIWDRGGDEGHGSVFWELSPDGARLHEHVIVRNPHYEGAMRYTTTYRRAGDGTTH